MVELITITESFYACGGRHPRSIAQGPRGSVMPDAVFSNIGKLLLATRSTTCTVWRIMYPAASSWRCPGPDEDHNPATRASLAAVMGGRPDIPADQRADVARLIEDLTVSHQAGWYSVISLHGGGSPEAMKREILAQLSGDGEGDLVEKLLDRGILDEGAAFRSSRAAAARPDASAGAFGQSFCRRVRARKRRA